MNHIQTVKQIFAQLAFANSVVRILVGSCKDANVNQNFFATAKPSNAALLEDSEELG